MKDASIVRIRPKKGKGKGEMVPLESKTVSQRVRSWILADDRLLERPSRSTSLSISGILMFGLVSISPPLSPPWAS